MKKLITFMILLFMSVVLVYAASHHIDKPLRVDGWVRTQGNVYPLWTEMYDLGKPDHWWDSLFCVDAEMRSILLWSADSTDSASMSPTKLVIDSMITLYWSTTSAILKQLTIETANDTVLCPDSVTSSLYSAFTIKTYRNQSTGETYGFRSYNYGTGAANTYGARFHADSMGSGEKIGSYSSGTGGYTYNGTIYGAKNIAESWGDAATPTMYGAYNYSAGCGVGKKFGAYNYGRGHSSSAGDSVFGAYNYGYGAGGTSKGIFGSYNNALGSAGDTTYGVYGKASGGDINWAGFFDGDLYVKDTTFHGGVVVDSSPHTFLDDIWHLNQKKSYWTDGTPGADTGLIYQSPSFMIYDSDNKHAFYQGGVLLAYLGSTCNLYKPLTTDENINIEGADSVGWGIGTADSAWQYDDGDNFVIATDNQVAFTNGFKSSTITTTADDVDVDNVMILNVNTTGGNVTIGSFANGVNGQILHIFNSATNDITFEDDEGTAGQDIKTNTAGDITITAEGGATLICDGSLWYIIGIAQ